MRRMRRAIRLWCVGLPLLVTGAVGALSADDEFPREGLLAAYDLGGGAEDLSGNGHHASVVGASGGADRFGRAGRALSFDGEDDGVLAPVDVRRSVHPELTIACWVRQDGPSYRGGFIVGQTDSREWRYFDSGPAPGGWKMPAFDDGAWKTGRGKFGYGEGDEETTLDFGSDPDNKRITAYFRRRFTVDAVTDYQGLGLCVQFDDGVVVYLNGRELGRRNMPDGPIDHGTPAKGSVREKNEYPRFGTAEGEYQCWPLDTGDLVAGENVIAAEVHQRGPNSSDLAFDLRLVPLRGATNAGPAREIAFPSRPGIGWTFVAAVFDADDQGVERGMVRVGNSQSHVIRTADRGCFEDLAIGLRHRGFHGKNRQNQAWFKHETVTFSGSIDDLFIWNRALDRSELEAVRRFGTAWIDRRSGTFEPFERRITDAAGRSATVLVKNLDEDSVTVETPAGKVLAMPFGDLSPDDARFFAERLRQPPPGSEDLVCVSHEGSSTAIIDYSGSEVVRVDGFNVVWDVPVFGADGRVAETAKVFSRPLRHEYTIYQPSRGDELWFVNGWDLHRRDGAVISPHGVSVNKGGKFGWLGLDGRIVIPPVHRDPLRYEGGTRYTVPDGGDRRDIHVQDQP